MRVAPLALLALVGCEQPRTELVVRVDTDMTWGVGQAVQSVRLFIGGGVRTDDRVTPLEAGRVELPLYVGVTPRDGDSEGVYLGAYACASASGCEQSEALAVQWAQVRFVRGQTMVVPMQLARVCAPGHCPQGERCVVPGGACEPAVFAQGSLVPYGSEVDAGDVVDASELLDGGTMDVGAMDVGAGDAGVDAGLDMTPLGDAPPGSDTGFTVDACPAGLEFRVCSGACVNVQIHPWHCAVCNNVCTGVGGSDYGQCIAGRCVQYLPDGAVRD